MGKSPDTLGGLTDPIYKTDKKAYLESQGYENLQPTSYLPATQGLLITEPPLITQGSSSSYLPTETPPHTRA